MAVEDVVAQDQADGLAADEVAADEEGVGQAARIGLLDIGELQPPLAAVPQQGPKAGSASGVLMTRISRMPASISIESG